MFPSSEFPKTRWTLTAPESYVVLNLDATYDPLEAMKLALRELVLLDALRVAIAEQKSLFGIKFKTSTLTHGKAMPPRALSLSSIYEVFDSNPITTVEELAKELRRLSGGASGYYIEQAVMQELIARRHVEKVARKVLWVIPTTHYVRTPTGEKARADLEARLLMAERLLEGWADQDPHKALTFLRLAGSAILLMPTALPNLQYILEQHSEKAHLDKAPDELGDGVNDMGASLAILLRGILQTTGNPLSPLPGPGMAPSIFERLDEIFRIIDSEVDAGSRTDTDGD